jgi:rhodanese-related sulfurtransferase
MPVPEISCEELALRLSRPEGRPVLLDVRRPDEHALVALPGSKLIPLHELQDHPDELEALKGQDVVVYCHHGVRSFNACAFLRELGIDAKSLAGGIDRWSLVVDPSVPRY